MKIVYYKTSELKPYKKNPRVNKQSIKFVAESIKQFGFKVPIVIDKNLEIIAGHTRLEASKLLMLDKVPCIVADDLSKEQVKAFRLADNKVAEWSKWDYEKLNEELSKLSKKEMQLLGFIEDESIDWDSIDELTEEIYEEPEHNMFECPYCGHKDRNIHFKKNYVSNEDDKL